ncbi:hypothetical protein ACWC98_38450 [Streptomyces goshikiensis]
MGDVSAGQRLATELTELRVAAGMSLTKIEAFGKAQVRPANLSRSKVSQWFNGKSVPTKGYDFDLLIQGLEPVARRQSGTRPQGIAYWRSLRDEADRDRSLAAAPGTPPHKTAVDTQPSGGHGQPGGPDPDAETADRLLKLLPPGESWFKWLRKAPTMFKVPLSVSNPVCDALEELEDRVDYVDPILQAAHDRLMIGLTVLCNELNGMTDISDEGPQVLEMSSPGTPAERNELNRQACEARDGFLPVYKEMVNLLNARGWVTRSPQTPGAPAGAPAVAVELAAGYTLANGSVMTLPISSARPRGEGITGPYFIAVLASNQSTVSVEISAAGLEIDAGEASGLLIPYLFPPRGPGGSTQLPYALGSHSGFRAHANAAEIGHGYKQIRDRGGVPRRVRPWVSTGAGDQVEGAWTAVDDTLDLIAAAFGTL